MSGAGSFDQQRLHHRQPVDVEHHQFVALRREAAEQRVDDRRGLHRRVDGRDERQDRRHVGYGSRRRERSDAPAQAAGQSLRLARCMETERLVLVGIDFGLDQLPRGTAEALQIGEPGADPPDRRQSRDADRGRDQDEARRARQLRIGARVERVVDGERRAVRVADHVDGSRGPERRAQVLHGELRGGSQVFHFEGEQSCRRRAVTRQAQTHHVIATTRRVPGRCCAGCRVNRSSRAAAARRRSARPRAAARTSGSS